MGNTQLYAYDDTKHIGPNRNIHTPRDFKAPGYIWKSAENGNPGHNVLLCFLLDKNGRSCCF